jgi:hypothetical protein
VPTFDKASLLVAGMALCALETGRSLLVLCLPRPGSGPGGPDGQGWNRPSLNAHFDRSHHCELLPSAFATLGESMTGRQEWGGFGRCPPLPPTPDATFVNVTAGLGSSELFHWVGVIRDRQRGEGRHEELLLGLDQAAEALVSDL